MDEKKKLMVLGALFAVIIAVGVFQFTRGGSPAPAQNAKSSSKPAGFLANGATDAKEELKNPQVAGNLPERDPFDAPYVVPANLVGSYAQAKPAPTSSNPRPRATTSLASVPRVPLVGPMPLPGNLETVGEPLPAEAKAEPAPKAEPKAPAAAPVFDYQVAGVLVGRRPLAVFRTKDGNQRLIAVGQKLDNDSKVVRISHDKVVVKFHGKELALGLEEGGTVAKQ